jgi:hypothetical protein
MPGRRRRTLGSSRTPVAMNMALVAAAALSGCATPALSPAGAGLQNRTDIRPFEVWIADQSDTRPGYGGQLLIYDGRALAGVVPADTPPAVRMDLGAETADLCRAATGRPPVRPHMILFNSRQTHAIVSFVASGHVVIFDAETRAPLRCFETTVSASTGTRQAHAAFPAPDGSYILVANQNGKQLERIDTDFPANAFAHNPAATIDLAACTTPSGQPCEQPGVRPLNWPICPIIDSSSRYGFVTLRGGGMLVVDAKATPMQIVAEYDRATVKGNGCGGAEAGDAMYVNSGGSPVNVSSADPHHPALFGFDVYRFPLTGYGAANLANRPAPSLVFSKGGNADSHGMAAAGGSRYLWVMDRHNDVAEIIDLTAGARVRSVNLNGPLTDNAAPDLVDADPSGTRLFVALRGPVPLSGDPHNATGSSPGFGIIEMTKAGADGSLTSIVRITNPNQQGTQQPDPHGLRVRLKG